MGLTRQRRDQPGRLFGRSILISDAVIAVLWLPNPIELTILDAILPLVILIVYGRITEIRSYFRARKE